MNKTISKAASLILAAVIAAGSTAAYADNPPAVTWSDSKREKEAAEQAMANIIEYDQRGIEVAQYMDEVNYRISPNGSRVKAYRKDRNVIASTPTGFQFETKKGQIISIINMDKPEEVYAPIQASSGTCSIDNLIPYYTYQVTILNPDERPVSTFKIRPTGATRFIRFNTVQNFRDLGGWKTKSGQTVRHGILYRGGEIQESKKESLFVEDTRIFEQLGIMKEVDLRSDAELTNTKIWLNKHGITEGGQLPNVIYENHPIASSYIEAVQLEGDKYVETIRALRSIFESVSTESPVYFHCTGGADKTAVIALLLEGILGVSEEDIDKDYELSTFAFYGNDRYRTYKPYEDFKNYLKDNYDGRTLNDKIFSWFTVAGFTEDEIEQFRMTMLQG